MDIAPNDDVNPTLRPHSPPPTWVVVSGLFLCVFLAYWPLHESEFVIFDTNYYISDNPHVRTGLSLANVWWAFTQHHAANWHPLTWISHQLDVTLFGPYPLGHFIHNVLLHMGNVILLFFLLRKITRQTWAPALAATMLAIHPLDVEVVAWIAQRKSLLSTFFGLWCLWFYLDFAQNRKKGTYLAALTCFTLGLLAKPMLVTWPCVLLLLDYWPLRRIDLPFGPSQLISEVKSHLGPLIKEKIPFFAVTLFVCWATVLAQGNDGAINSLSRLGPWERMSNAIVSYTVYLRDFLAPVNLAVYYPHPYTARPLWMVLCSGFILAAISLFTLWYSRQDRRPLVGWLFYLGTMVPVIGLVQVGEMTHADRYWYLPSIGIYLMVFFSLGEILPKLPVRRGFWIGLASIWCGSLGLATFFQVRVWKNSITLFEHTLAHTENNPLIEDNLGSAYYFQGNYPKAELHLENALAIRKSSGTYRILGLVKASQGQKEEAIENFIQAIRRDPERAQLRVDLGKAYFVAGQKEKAFIQLQKAIELDPALPSAHISYARMASPTEAIKHLMDLPPTVRNLAEIQFELGTLLFAQKRYEEASRCLEDALKDSRPLVNVRYYLGMTAMRLGDFQSAQEYLNDEIALFPANNRSYLALSDLALKQGNPKKAALQLAKLIKRVPDHQKAHYQLAGIYYQVGQKQYALDTVRRLLTINKDHQDGLRLFGLIQMSFKEYGEAIEAFEHLVKLEPESQNRLMLVEALKASGQEEKAFEIVEKILDSEPTNAPALRLREELLSKGKP